MLLAVRARQRGRKYDTKFTIYVKSRHNHEIGSCERRQIARQIRFARAGYVRGQPRQAAGLQSICLS